MSHDDELLDQFNNIQELFDQIEIHQQEINTINNSLDSDLLENIEPFVNYLKEESEEFLAQEQLKPIQESLENFISCIEKLEIAQKSSFLALEQASELSNSRNKITCILDAFQYLKEVSTETEIEFDSELFHSIIELGMVFDRFRQICSHHELPVTVREALKITDLLFHKITKCCIECFIDNLRDLNTTKAQQSIDILAKLSDFHKFDIYTFIFNVGLSQINGINPKEYSSIEQIKNHLDFFLKTLSQCLILYSMQEQKLSGTSEPTYTCDVFIRNMCHLFYERVWIKKKNFSKEENAPLTEHASKVAEKFKKIGYPLVEYLEVLNYS